jgi:hypothetical protein
MTKHCFEKYAYLPDLFDNGYGPLYLFDGDFLGTWSWTLPNIDNASTLLYPSPTHEAPPVD